MKLPGKGLSWKEFGRALAKQWKEDRVGDTSQALAFAGVLALFPFLLFLVALAGLIIDPVQAEQLVQQLGQVAPPQVTQILGDRIRNLATSNSAALLTVGAVVAIWSSSGGAMSAMSALNLAYDVEEQRPFWKTRGIALLSTVFGALLVLAATLIAVATPALAGVIGGPAGTLILWLRLPVAGLAMMLVWALLYYFLPDTEQDFKFITPGSVIGVVIWLVASWAFSFYVSHFGNYDATYGALGGVIVLLLWMWISSMVFILGAEVNAILEHESPEGKRAGAKRLADRGETRKSSERTAPPGTAPAAVPAASPSALAPAKATPHSRGRLRGAGLFAMGLGLAVGLGGRRGR